LIMQNFDEIRRLDFHHAMIMAAILVITGSGALFFIVVIQNYYVVNRTLKQTQDYSRIVFTNMPIGLLSINLSGKVVAYNPKVLEILDLDERAILKQRIDQIIDFQGFSLNRTPTGCDTVLEKELFHRKNSDHAIPISLSSTPIIDDKNICLGALIIIRDLSEIKRLEEKVRRSEKLAAVGELAAGLAHEIRNPLSSIRGFAQFFKHTLKDHPREQEYAQTMVAEIDRINRVVTDLLSMARPKKLELELADVGALVKRVADLVKTEAKSRNLFLEVFIQPDMNPVSVDASLITQALLNLLLNATHSVEPGSRVAVGTELKSGRQLSIWVEDDGPGIPINLQQKVFEPFYTTREAGTGLGLAIVRSIAENHEGAVQLESPPPGLDHGCRFTITIPVRATVEE
jgi:two-component system sensor histidine kinase HydH